MSHSQRKLLYHILVIVIAGFISAILFTIFQPFNNINLWLSDKLFVSEKPSPNIVIAGIDEKTLQAFGRLSEWPRDLHSKAITNLDRDKAKVIGFDILFIDQSSDDNTLAQSMKNAGNVVLPLIGLKSTELKEHIVHFKDIVFPVTPLKNSCVNMGHVNIVPDSDGVVRHFPLVISDDSGQNYGSFSLAVLSTLFDSPLPSKYILENNTVHVVNRDIKVDDSYEFRINFASENKDFYYISYIDIIRGNYDPLVVRNKIVLIGATVAGELDTWTVPVSVEKMPGIIIHAIAIDTILRERFLTNSSIGITLITILLLVGLTALILPRLRLLYGGLCIVGLIALYLIAVSIAFDNGYILNILYPLLTLSIVYSGSVLCQIIIVQSEKNFVKDFFGRYVSPQVVREIIALADVNKLELGGEQREVTILFADIRHFTEISEHMSPAAIVDMLNTYFSTIIDKVLKNGGTINKFAGDNIMAIWNAPQNQPLHAILAIKAAWEAQEAIHKMRLDEHSKPTVQFGIGVNTGQALAGNIGSLRHTEYTVIGDAVNLAARICEATPGDEIWIGSQTYHQAKDNVKVIELEPQMFKGKTEKVILYHVIGCNTKQ